MKNLLIITGLILSTLSFTACQNENETAIESISDDAFLCPMKCEGEKTYTKEGTCPVCHMDLKLVADKPVLADEILEESVFNLTSKWTTHHAEQIELKELKGDVLVMVMIYTSCKSACPRLVADMRNIEKETGSDGIKFVMVSIDPEVDTPERFRAFAKENLMESEQWIFLNGHMDDVRELANVLSVKYKSINPIDFSHSNIISVFDREGVLQYQEEGLGVDNNAIVSKVKSLVL